MATIERRRRGGRGSPVRWRDADGRGRNKTFEREEDARRYRARLEGDMASGTWIDPSLARMSVRACTGEWRKSVVDLRPSTLARLDATVNTQVLPAWGSVPLSGVTNADVRAWAARLHAEGLSASSVRKAVFALRRILAAAVADRRLSHSPAEHVPMPVEEPGEQRYLTAAEVADLAEAVAPRFRAMVLVAAYGGLRFGELAALRRGRVDLLRGRVVVAETLVDVNGVLTFGPTKTRNGRRTVPLPRSTCREVAAHVERHVAASADALLFTGEFRQPLRHSGFPHGVPGRFPNAHAFKSYCGLAPKASETGETDAKGQPISKAGSAWLRDQLLQSANTARRTDPQLAAVYYRQMVHRGAHHQKALTVVAAKLAERCWAVLQRGSPYVLADVDGTPVSPTETKRIITERYTVSEQLRAQRRSRKTAKKVGKAPHQVLAAHASGQTLDASTARSDLPHPPSSPPRRTRVKTVTASP